MSYQEVITINIVPLFDIENLIPILSKISIFGGFNDTQLYKVFRKLEKASYRDLECVFKQGSAPTYIYIILRGRVRMIQEVEGINYQLFEFGVGNCIGEDSVIGIQPHTLSAIAIGDVELAVISKKALLDFYETDRDLFTLLILNIAREISRRLKLTDNLLLHYIDKVSHPD